MMTDNKRFRKYETYLVTYILDNENPMNGEEILDMLNQLNDENLYLKKELEDALSDVKIYKKANYTFDNIYQEKEQIYKENNELKRLLHLIAHADSWEKEDSVQEILRDTIRGLDAVSYEYASAWNDYCILSKFFEKEYGENWDND